MNDNQPLVESDEFRTQAKQLTDKFRLRHKMGLDSTFSPDFQKSLADTIDRWALMLDLQADIIASADRIEKLNQSLNRDFRKGAAKMMVLAGLVLLLNLVAILTR